MSRFRIIHHFYSIAIQKESLHDLTWNEILVIINLASSNLIVADKLDCIISIINSLILRNSRLLKEWRLNLFMTTHVFYCTNSNNGFLSNFKSGSIWLRISLFVSINALYSLANLSEVMRWKSTLLSASRISFINSAISG